MDHHLKIMNQYQLNKKVISLSNSNFPNQLLIKQHIQITFCSGLGDIDIISQIISNLSQKKSTMIFSKPKVFTTIFFNRVIANIVQKSNLESKSINLFVEVLNTLN